MSRTYNVIDSDGHILEPPNLCADYLDPEYKDKAPKLVVDDAGRARLHIEGKVLEGNSRFGFEAIGGIGVREGKPAPTVYTDGREGGFDPHARIKDLDLDGIDAAFLYPSLGLVISGSIEDAKYSAALCRAYNRWLAEEYCSAYPDRLFGVAMLPMQSIELAAVEARYAREQLGMRAAFIRPNPYNGRGLDNPEYDSLWQVAQDLDMSIGIHEGTNRFIKALGTDRVNGDSARHMVSHTMEMMLASLSVIWGGVCDRFPRLRFGFLESGGGWMVGWLDRMERHFDDRSLRGDAPPLRPREYFERQCWISFEPVEGSLALSAQYLGADRLLWATDYPHRDGFFPGAPKMIADKLPVEMQRPVLAGGAMGFYNL